MARFELSPQAEESFREIWEWYARKAGDEMANRILGEFHDAITKLIDNPRLGHLRPDLTERPWRFYRVYSYFLVYDPESSPLYVARVFHSAQDVKRRMG